MAKENSQAEEWLCVVLRNPVWYFVTGKGKEAEILTDKRRKLNGGRNVLLIALRKLQHDGVFFETILSNTLRLSRAPY